MSIAAEPANAAREQFMRVAIEQARRSMAAGGPPVGACLTQNNRVIARAQNSVIAQLDVSAHAEIVLLRDACRELRSLDLSGCDMYVTVEPCLMCFSACSYAGIGAIFFGAAISSMQRYTGNEICVSRDRLPERDEYPELHGGLLAESCTILVDEWGAAGRHPRGKV